MTPPAGPPSSADSSAGLKAAALLKSAGLRSRRATLIAAAVTTVVILAAVVFFTWSSPNTPRAIPSAKPTPTPTKDPTTAQIYAAVSPSVVSIRVTRNPAKAAAENTVFGTGVIVNADGSIVTALHVVDGAEAILVTYLDNVSSPAAIAATDPTQDIAVLTPSQLPAVVVPAVLGASGRLAVGDTVTAIGNQLGLSSSMTAGVVSGLDRSTTTAGGVQLNGLIQFDAAVNPGSSGGPLVNAKGQTVGIVVALANPTAAGTFVGVGFAVPITAAVGGRGGDQRPQQ